MNMRVLVFCEYVLYDILFYSNGFLSNFVSECSYFDQYDTNTIKPIVFISIWSKLCQNSLSSGKLKSYAASTLTNTTLFDS